MKIDIELKNRFFLDPILFLTIGPTFIPRKNVPKVIGKMIFTSDCVMLRFSTSLKYCLTYIDITPQL